MLAMLLTTSSTTGWTDWAHGELWLTREAIVRVRARGQFSRQLRDAAVVGALGAVGSVAAGVGGHIAAAVFGHSLTQQDLARFRDLRPDHLAFSAQSDRRVRVVWLRDVRAFNSRVGIANGRLSVSLFSGRRLKLLWLRDPTVNRIVESALGDPAAFQAWWDEMEAALEDGA
ncbi:MAG: hypothetical protein QM572_01905 [Nocardioides sp.]|uniref:hypothetical protein n=1 Tax=Nocardioides sp. TaxID=35761 RepID=UPI0039E54647